MSSSPVAAEAERLNTRGRNMGVSPELTVKLLMLWHTSPLPCACSDITILGPHPMGGSFECLPCLRILRIVVRQVHIWKWSGRSFIVVPVNGPWCKLSAATICRRATPGARCAAASVIRRSRCSETDVNANVVCGQSLCDSLHDVICASPPCSSQ